MGKAKKDETKVKKEEDVKKEEKEGDEEEEFQWWENEEEVDHGDGMRWKTLSHNGVFFAPPYIPHDIPIKYDRVTFKMTPEEEEVATMFAILRNNDYYKSEVFRHNFFAAWKEILDKRPEGRTIRRLEYCDFTDIWEWHLRERDRRLTAPREEKKRLKEEQAKLVEPFRHCIWDGRKEPVANFRVEPPGLFRGRGKHPLQGCLKRRIEAEDITVNISEDAEPPAAPPGHKWKEIVHKPDAMWLCMWKDTVTGNFKYVMPDATSSIKGLLDRRKFEKARKLKGIIDSVRASYSADFRNDDIFVQQRAIAMYFIDRLALRVGNEKGEDEADTVGCCSLRVEHLKLVEPSSIDFDFLGKDSVRYKNTVKVDPAVFKLVGKLMRGKGPQDDIFDHLNPGRLNDHLKSFMEGLSAKVFRTYNASFTLDCEFHDHPVDPELTVPDKMAYFTEANTKVAVLCNHQKGVSKNHGAQVDQLNIKVKELEALLERVEHAQKLAKKSDSSARDYWMEQEDAVQWGWLNEYGTEEDKEAYRAGPTKPSRTRSASASQGTSKKPRSSSRKKKTVIDDDSSDDETIAQKFDKPSASRKKAAPKKRGRDSDSEDFDALLSSLKTKTQAAKKKVKKEDSDSSEDEAIGNFLKK
eukprot:PhM_4_TR5235/c1_g1_i1/m.737/K03163/TOP1; DNA topoisomerase I